MATTTTLMAPSMEQAKTAPTTTTTRRQNHSCDRCRHGKRACDASGTLEGHETCSNCAKAGKQCTFVWLQSTASKRYKITSKRGEKRKRLQEESPQSISETTTTSSIGSDRHMSNGEVGPRTVDDSNSNRSLSPWANNVPPALRLNGLYGTERMVPVRGPLLSGSLAPSSATLVAEASSESCYDPFESIEILEDGLIANNDEIEEVLPESESSSVNNSMVAYNASNHMTLFNKYRQPHLPPGVAPNNFLATAGVFDGLCQTQNKRLISESLLQVYQDSMENALSCWLTRNTCPYEMDGRGAVLSIRSSSSQQQNSNMSNRIWVRVVSLDKASHALRDQPLSPADQRLAAQALDATILAFAGQWSRIFEPDNTFGSGSSTSDKSHRPLEEVFDRTLQEQLWQDARRRLKEASDIDSFKVIFANMIFAFTQRPLDLDQVSERFQTNGSPRFREARSTSHSSSNTDSNGSSHSYFDEAFTSSNAADLEELIGLEGPPVFLETALRQLYAWRHQMEKIRRKRKINKCADTNPLNKQDMETFNFLFWLGIMLETLSAAMNNRPLVVSDEDSSVIRQTTIVETSSQSYEPKISAASLTAGPKDTDGSDGPWGTLFLHPKQHAYRPIIRWPCSFDDASAALSDACPVKVLLFRRVTRLQTLQYRRATPEQLEEAIQDSLTVYEHWNSTYGPLILDFITNHEELPPQVQSWYVVLTGHWHLGVFLLVDTIQSIDSDGRGHPARQRLRQSSHLLQHIREQSAFEIAEVARVSAPDLDSTFYKTSNFHDHLNQGALLTEPWTDVLIRTFGKACCLFLDWLALHRSAGFYPNPRSAQTLYLNCAKCIKGLNELGRKSDLARLVAVTFQPRLEQLRQTTRM